MKYVFLLVLGCVGAAAGLMGAVIAYRWVHDMTQTPRIVAGERIFSMPAGVVPRGAEAVIPKEQRDVAAKVPNPVRASPESIAIGRARFGTFCTPCHGPEAKGGAMYGTMVGGIGSFTTNTRVLTPGSMYPYAPILFDYVRRSMPMDRPLSMTADEVYAVSAYILNLNGLVPADAVLGQATLPKVQMPNRDNFVLDDRPDTRAVRCMRDCR